MELREDTLSIFHKHKIPLLNAMAKAMPASKFDMSLVRVCGSENSNHTRIELQIDDRIVNFGFDNEFDTMLFLRGMVSMKDLMSSPTLKQYIQNALLSMSE